MAETVDTPDKPPLAWIDEDPEGYTPGSTLTVDYDGQLWGDPGRVCGIIQPPPGHRYIGAGSYGHKIPDRYPDETFSDFHVGPMQFIDPNGNIVQRQVGSIATEGGHSTESPDFAVLAETGNIRDRVKGAVDWLQRRGKHAHLTKDLAVYGKITRVTSGPARGALKFNGAAYPWLTRDQAMAINATTNSSEQWKHPDHNMREQFIGVARVHMSAYRNDIPATLAELEDGCGCDVDDAMCIVTPRGRMGEFSHTEPESLPVEPVLAEVEQPEFDAQTNRITTLEERLDTLEAMLSSFIINQTDGDGLTANNRVDSLSERLPLIEQTLQELRETLERLTGTPATPGDELNHLTAT